MTEADPPMPTGTTVAPVRAARKATPSCRSWTTGPVRRSPSGNKIEHLAGVEHLLGPPQGLAVGRLPVDGERPDGREDLANRPFFQRLSLAM